MQAMFKLVAITILTAVTVMLSVGPAAAADWSLRYRSSLGSETYEFSKGEVRGNGTARAHDVQNKARLILADRDSDGFGMISYWKSGSKSGSCVNEKGNGKTQTCNLSVSTGSWVVYQHCMKDGSTILVCSPEDGFRA